jgi:hypothetical protein
MPFGRAVAGAALWAGSSLEGKIDGYGVPGGLPLIFRFSGARGAFSSISQWRTLFLVNPAMRGVHALSFPKMMPVHLL